MLGGTVINRGTAMIEGTVIMNRYSSRKLNIITKKIIREITRLCPVDNLKIPKRQNSRI